MGDFNLDWTRRFDASYAYMNYYDDMEQAIGDLGLNQVVEHPTWSRTIRGVVKESVIDHVYLANPLSISEINYSWQTYTDHSLISFPLSQDMTVSSPTWKRDWRRYSKSRC